MIDEPEDTDPIIVDEADLADCPNTIAGDLTMPADVLIADQGSVALFTPLTAEAHQWVEENVEVEPWQRMGTSVACEPWCLEQLIAGMQQDGLVVEPE